MSHTLQSKAELGKGRWCGVNWKQEATEKLRKYDAMRMAVQNIPQEIRRLQIAAGALKSMQADGAPGGGNLRGKEDQIINNLAHRQELAWNLEQAKCWLEVTDRAMHCLLPEEKQILHRLYVQPDKSAMEQLCRELGVEQSSVYRRRDRALERFAVALYGTAAS